MVRTACSSTKNWEKIRPVTNLLHNTAKGYSETGEQCRVGKDHTGRYPSKLQKSTVGCDENLGPEGESSPTPMDGQTSTRRTWMTIFHLVF